MIEIHIRPRLHVGSLLDEVYICDYPQRPMPGDMIRNLEVVNGELVFKEYIHRSGEELSVKPAFLMDTRMVREITAAFLELARTQGQKPHNESRTEGELEATLKHLSDMRELVFTKKPFNKK